jgi:hypothetical protein
MTAVAVHNALKRFILRKESFIIADFKQGRNQADQHADSDNRRLRTFKVRAPQLLQMHFSQD